MEAWKIEKLKSIDKEVDEFHPLLRAVFSNDKSISRHEYTQGPSEMGADFVLARLDPTLGDENYIGVIVKCGNIKQDHAEVKRQIEECAVERYFDGGKKKIYLNETWVVCNGSISHGAERKIYEDFRSRNIKFIDIDRLALLVDQHYPHFWSSIPTELGLYLQKTLIDAAKAESYNSLGFATGDIDVGQDLYEIEPSRPGRKISKFNKSRRSDLNKALLNNRFLMIEGGMGSGKTTLLRRHIKRLCDPGEFQKNKTIPRIIHYSSIEKDPASGLSEIIRELEGLLTQIDGNKILIVIDGLDEVRSATDGSIGQITRMLGEIVQATPHLTVIVASRPVWTIEEGEELLRQVPRYQILPLSFEQIVKVVQLNCGSIMVSERLRQDLGRSALLKALPRTPMSALLLARVLNANAKEIPQTLPELYSKYIELALGRWDITKGLMTEREYPVILHVLSEVAKYMLDNELQQISTSEVMDMLEKYTATREGLPKAEEIFRRVQQRTEVASVDVERKIFSFRHKSLAEYLLALHQKDNYGKTAPLSNPFEGYWLGVEYFYLGLIRDAGKRIDKLSSLQLSSEREKILRCLNFGNLMLSAYQTEYEHIEKATYQVMLEMTKYFLDVKHARISSSLSILPELQFFATLTYLLRGSFEYAYFAKALESAQLLCQVDESLTAEERCVASFFIDAPRAGLGETDTFKFLTDQELGNLPWVVKLGIKHIADDDGLKHDHISHLERRIAKARKNNPGLGKYVKELYEGSMMKAPHQLR